MKLAIISDLHLDCVNPQAALQRIETLNRITADYLVVAGDICEMKNAERFLPLIKPNVKKVIVVKGNHEFYHTHLNCEIDYPNNFVCLKVGQPFVVDDIAFVGDTLWSFVPDERMHYIEYFMNDYDLITDKHGDGITCSDTNALHEHQRKRLYDDVCDYIYVHQKKVVVVTHHSPSFKGVSEKFSRHPANCAFHSNELDQYTFATPTVWIHGHTHDGLDYVQHGIRVVCNPWGYSNERFGVTDFSDEIIKYIEV